MKKILVFLLAIAALASCREWDPVLTLDYPEPPEREPVMASVNTSIAALKQMYLDNGNKRVEIRGQVVIGGQVISSDRSGNIYRDLYIQDGTGAICVKLGKSSLYSDYHLGQWVFVDCNGLTVGAYNGTDSFIFISYAHRNSDKVIPIIAKMQADGYRVWFDEGIDPGTEWDANIANHVRSCDLMIAFISKEYLNSENCKDELNFARDLGKNRILIYLENVELPDGMAMRLNRLQAIHQYKYEDQKDFYEKLYNSPDMQSLR